MLQRNTQLITYNPHIHTGVSQRQVCWRNREHHSGLHAPDCGGAQAAARIAARASSRRQRPERELNLDGHNVARRQVGHSSRRRCECAARTAAATQQPHGLWLHARHRPAVAHFWLNILELLGRLSVVLLGQSAATCAAATATLWRQVRGRARAASRRANQQLAADCHAHQHEPDALDNSCCCSITTVPTALGPTGSSGAQHQLGSTKAHHGRLAHQSGAHAKHSACANPSTTATTTTSSPSAETCQSTQQSYSTTTTTTNHSEQCRHRTHRHAASVASHLQRCLANSVPTQHVSLPAATAAAA